MKHYMKVRFIFRPSESKAETALGAIVCRITVDKARKKFTTPVSCQRREWDAKAQRLRGTAKKARLDNGVLTDIEADINRLYYDMERASEYITAERLMGAYLVKEKPRVTLVAAWQEWEQQRAALVGKSITKATHIVYKNKGQLLQLFLRKQEQLKMLPDEFTERQCDLFISWLRTERGLSQNYTNKAIQVLKQFLRWCKRHDHAKTQPLSAYGLKNAPVKPPVFLTLQDIARLSAHTFVSEALQRVVHIFLFQCYTGLAYVDLARFNAKEHVRTVKGGGAMIIMSRQKTSHSTGQEATIPLLKEAQAILQRYGNTLPVPTNQVYNRMLKEAAAVVGLGSHITSHVGRKTAGRLWLDAGVPIAAVSKALGHRTIAMTEQYYVRVGEDLVTREFNRVFGQAAPGFEEKPKHDEGAAEWGMAS